MKKQAMRFGPWVILLAVGTVATSRTANPAPPPEYPRLHAAYDALREARGELERSRHDFCGHRREAMEDTERAMNQIRRAMECHR
jgi:hypothetical protein